MPPWLWAASSTWFGESFFALIPIARVFLPEGDRWCFLGYLRLQTLLYPGTTKYSLLLPGLKVKIVPG